MLKIWRSFRALKVLKNVKARKTRLKLPLIQVDVDRDVKKREISDLDSLKVDTRKEKFSWIWSIENLKRTVRFVNFIYQCGKSDQLVVHFNFH